MNQEIEAKKALYRAFRWQGMANHPDVSHRDAHRFQRRYPDNGHVLDAARCEYSDHPLLRDRYSISRSNNLLRRRHGETRAGVQSHSERSLCSRAADLDVDRDYAFRKLNCGVSLHGTQRRSLRGGCPPNTRSMCVPCVLRPADILHRGVDCGPGYDRVKAWLSSRPSRQSQPEAIRGHTVSASHQLPAPVNSPSSCLQQYLLGARESRERHEPKSSRKQNATRQQPMRHPLTDGSTVRRVGLRCFGECRPPRRRSIESGEDRRWRAKLC